MSLQTLLHIKSCKFNCFFKILISIKMKLGQILVKLTTNVFNSLRLKTNFSPSMILRRCHCAISSISVDDVYCFLFCPIVHVERTKNPQTHLHNQFLVNCWRLENLKVCDLGPSLPNHAKIFLKILPMAICFILPCCMAKRFMIQKTY